MAGVAEGLEILTLVSTGVFAILALYCGLACSRIFGAPDVVEASLEKLGFADQVGVFGYDYGN